MIDKYIKIASYPELEHKPSPDTCTYSVISVDSVAPIITVNEQSESNPDCSFHSSIAYFDPGDHITRL